MCFFRGETTLAAEVLYDVRSLPPVLMMEAECTSCTFLDLARFVEMKVHGGNETGCNPASVQHSANSAIIKTTDCTIVDASGALAEVLRGKLNSIGYQYFKFKMTSGDIEVPVIGTETYETHYGPMFELNVIDTMWGGTRVANYSFMADRRLVPYFPYVDVKMYRKLTGASFFNSLANKLKFGAAMADWVADQEVLGKDAFRSAAEAFDDAAESVRDAIVIQ